MRRTRTPLALIAALVGERLCVVDVGARGGLSPRWARFAEVMRGYGFEPHPLECATLNRDAACAPYPMTFLPNALGAVDGERRTFHVCRDPGSSSLFEPNRELCGPFAYSDRLDVVDVREVMLTRLDTVCEDHCIAPDVLKIDAQGAELEVLEGATGVLDSVLAVEVEVEFVQQYRRQPLFADVDRFLRERGFVLRGLRRSSWRRQSPEGWPMSTRGGQLIHGDALYVAAPVVDWREELDRTPALKAVIALAAYHQDDLVLSMLAEPHPGLVGLTDVERRQIAEHLTVRPALVRAQRTVRAMRRTVERVRSSHRRPDTSNQAARVSLLGFSRLRAAVDALRPIGSTDWHDAEFY